MIQTVLLGNLNNQAETIHQFEEAVKLGDITKAQSRFMQILRFDQRYTIELLQPLDYNAFQYHNQQTSIQGSSIENLPPQIQYLIKSELNKDYEAIYRQKLLDEENERNEQERQRKYLEEQDKIAKLESAKYQFDQQMILIKQQEEQILIQKQLIENQSYVEEGFPIRQKSDSKESDNDDDEEEEGEIVELYSNQNAIKNNAHNNPHTHTHTVKKPATNMLMTNDQDDDDDDDIEKTQVMKADTIKNKLGQQVKASNKQKPQNIEMLKGQDPKIASRQQQPLPNTNPYQTRTDGEDNLNQIRIPNQNPVRPPSNQNQQQGSGSGQNFKMENNQQFVNPQQTGPNQIPQQNLNQQSPINNNDLNKQFQMLNLGDAPIKDQPKPAQTFYNQSFQQQQQQKAVGPSPNQFVFQQTNQASITGTTKTIPSTSSIQSQMSISPHTSNGPMQFNNPPLLINNNNNNNINQGFQRGVNMPQLVQNQNQQQISNQQQPLQQLQQVPQQYGSRQQYTFNQPQPQQNNGQVDFRQQIQNQQQHQSSSNNFANNQNNNVTNGLIPNVNQQWQQQQQNLRSQDSQLVAFNISTESYNNSSICNSEQTQALFGYQNNFNINNNQVPNNQMINYPNMQGNQLNQTRDNMQLNNFNNMQTNNNNNNMQNQANPRFNNNPN